MKFDLIISIPKNTEDEAIFKEKTVSSTLIIGSSTCLFMVDKFPFTTLIDALKYALSLKKQIFVTGVPKVITFILKYYSQLIHKVHISILANECDTFNFGHEWVISSYVTNPEFTHYEIIKNINGENEYLSVLCNVLNHGVYREGRNGSVKSIFGQHMKFNLENGFPLLTTKKMFFRGIVEELLFFLNGHTDNNILREKNINIWTANTSREFLDSIGFTTRKEGLMGPMYGAQWRHFNGDYDIETGEMSGGIDQLKYVINTILKEPYSRRILMTDFNPSQAEEGVLYPCHSIILQFYIEDEFLDCFCFNRSSDVFLGLPFNIASTALLMYIIGKITHLTPRFLNLSLGDAHIYKGHIQNSQMQLTRKPFVFPQLQISDRLKTLTDISQLKYNDFILSNYQHHNAIQAEMVA